MSQAFDLAKASDVVDELIATINENRAFLSEIDGAIGDGDHGVNMSKGFTQCGVRLGKLPAPVTLAQALDQLAQVLMDDIGGSMGPLYGSFFLAFVEVLERQSRLDAAVFDQALAGALQSVQDLGGAKVGDKTLVDTLSPAHAAFRQALHAGAPFARCLEAMSEAAEAGKESTRAMQARIGRSARLGPRSIGVLDAGATSCCLILQSMARSLRRQLSP